MQRRRRKLRHRSGSSSHAQELPKSAELGQVLFVGERILDPPELLWGPTFLNRYPMQPNEVTDHLLLRQAHLSPPARTASQVRTEH